MSLSYLGQDPIETAQKTCRMSRTVASVWHRTTHLGFCVCSIPPRLDVVILEGPTLGGLVRLGLGAAVRFKRIIFAIDETAVRVGVEVHLNLAFRHGQHKGCFGTACPSQRCRLSCGSRPTLYVAESSGQLAHGRGS